MNYLAEEGGRWRHPVEEPPPHGTKIIILSPYGIAQTGDWYPQGAAWMPLPKVGAPLQDRLRKEGLLK